MTEFERLVGKYERLIGEFEKIIGVGISILISLSYSYFFSSKFPKGKYRLISILPILYLFTILPLYLSFTLTRFITSFCISWLANFKILLFCFDKGPLSWAPAHRSLLFFIAIAALPCKIKLKEDHPDSKYSIPKKPDIIPLNLPIKILFFSILITLLHIIWEGDHYIIHQKFVQVLYIGLIYLTIEIVIASFSGVVQALVGIELEPPSYEPYFSTSLQDFWGKRWNLMITNILRHSIYIPLRSASTGLLGKNKVSLVPIFISFVVSGLLHEFFLYYYLTREDPSWEMSPFFLLHGVCVVGEMVVKRRLAGGRWWLPPYVSVALTLVFNMATSVWMFLPPITKAGLDLKVRGEVVLVFECLKDIMQFILRYYTTLLELRHLAM